MLVDFKMEEQMEQLLVLRAYKLLGTIKYKIVQTTWTNKEIRKLRFTYLPPAWAFFFVFLVHVMITSSTHVVFADV